MKLFTGCFIGLVLSVSVGAESLLEGRVRLSSGQPAVGVQVRLFDLTDLRRFLGTTTDEIGHFALPLRAFSTARGPALPTDFALGQNYPNPFNPSTIIPYQLPTASHVRLEVFNILGQRLATLVDAERPAGAYMAQWDGTDKVGRAMGAGVYIYRLSSGGMTESRRMVLVDGQAGVPAAQGSDRVAVESAVEADGPVYGLTVSGAGLVAYVNPAFRVGVDEADIVLEEHGGRPGMKLVVGGVLGDVTNDGRVDAFDAQYVALYSEDSSIILPNNGAIALGNVNGDAAVDLADALLLAAYGVNPSDPSLPAGIGKVVAVQRGGSVSQIGEFVWRYETGDRVYSSPFVSDGVVYVGSYDGFLYALDAESGALRWRYETDGWVVSSPFVSDGVVYVGSTIYDSDDGFLYALDAESGALRWRYETDGWVASPVVSDGVVYVGSDGSVYTLDAESGALRWRYEMGEWVSSPVVSDGVVYVGSAIYDSYADFLYALDAESGALRWRYEMGDYVSFSPLFVSDGVLYGDSDDGFLYALDAESGALRWHYDIGDRVEVLGDRVEVFVSDVFDGVLYVSSVDGFVYALDAESGALRLAL